MGYVCCRECIWDVSNVKIYIERHLKTQKQLDRFSENQPTKIRPCPQFLWNKIAHLHLHLVWSTSTSQNAKCRLFQTEKTTWGHERVWYWCVAFHLWNPMKKVGMDGWMGSPKEGCDGKHHLWDIGNFKSGILLVQGYGWVREYYDFYSDVYLYLYSRIV